MVQGLRVGQRLDIFDRPAMDQVTHRQFDDLAAFGARDFGHLEDFRRHMARRGFGPDARFDAGDEIIIQAHTGTQGNEQHHPHIAAPLLANYQTLGDLVNALDLAVDFGGADAHPAGVEHRVERP